MGMPRLRQAYTPHPVVDRSPARSACVHRRHRPHLGAPFHAGGARRPHGPARGRRSPGPVVRADDTAAAGARHRGQPPSAVRGEPLDGLPADRAADGGAGRGHAQRDEPSAGQDRRTSPPDGVPRVLGIHRGESRGQRRHGGCAARVFPGHPRVGRQWNHRAIQQHDLVRDDFGRQRPHPQRDSG